MAFVAYSPPPRCTSCFGATATTASSSSPPSTRCFVPRLKPLPASSFSTIITTASASASASASRRRIGAVTATATSLSFFPSTIFLNRVRVGVRGRDRDRPFAALAAVVAAAARNTTNTNINTNPSGDGKRKESEKKQLEEKEEEEVEEEEDLPWIQEKALDVVEFTGSVTQAIPGPRVGSSSLPWILALPLAYISISFLFAIIKTLRNFNTPKVIRRNLVNKNAMLCKSIDEMIEKGRDGVQPSTLEGLMQKTGFGMGEILRKYIRYALNEKPFNPELVGNLIQLRKASSLDDSQVADIINEISRRIVKDKGPVVMDMSGYSEKGFKRKIAVQTLFGKIYYLSELLEFCSRDSSLIVKEIFGVADEDAEKLRMHTLSDPGDVDSLERMIDDGSDSEEYSSDGSSTIA